MIALKILTLIPNYLYEFKKLSLPGIGIFTISADVHIPEPGEKDPENFQLQIQFQQVPVLAPDPALIDYIKQHTRKITPLAIADLESFLADGKAFLNIGKPFFLEGIGTLYKDKNGHIDFIPGIPIAERVENKPLDGPDEKLLFSSRPKKETIDPLLIRKIWMMAVGILALVLVIWGGYTLYKKLIEKDPNTEIIENTASFQLTDTTSKKLSGEKTTDSIPNPIVTAPLTDSIVYTFVLQKTRSKEIADTNFNRIKSIRKNVFMTKSDSATYLICVKVKCIPADTLLKKQALNQWFWGKKEMRVSILH